MVNLVQVQNEQYEQVSENLVKVINKNKELLKEKQANFEDQILLKKQTEKLEKELKLTNLTIGSYESFFTPRGTPLKDDIDILNNKDALKYKKFYEDEKVKYNKVRNKLNDEQINNVILQKQIDELNNELNRRNFQYKIEIIERKKSNEQTNI